ncbi:MAG: radical SAM protein [Planctomycetes bacterium]|nr:radical SAM protein [Planctomycetota bacterium]
MLHFLRKLSNYALVNAERVLGRQRVFGRPYYVVLDPTSACQLDCPFCGREQRPNTRMDFATFKGILDSIGSTCVNLELYNWGEPFLNTDILEMIRYATRRYRIHTRISSNLNVKNDALYRDLVSSGLNSLTCSIDGASQETYERYRVKGSFQTVLDNVRLMRARRDELGAVEPKLVWQFLVFRHNEHEMDLATRMAREIGVDEIVFRRPHTPDEYRSWDSSLPRFSNWAAAPACDSNAADSGSGGGATAGQTEVAAATAVALQEEPTAPVVQPATQPAAQSAAQPATQPARCATKCNWPYSAVAINATGSVSACCGVTDPADDYGSAREKGFATVWNSEDYRVARDAVRAHRVVPGSANTCARCEFKGEINFSANLKQFLYYTLPWLRRAWIRRRGFRAKIG